MSGLRAWALVLIAACFIGSGCVDTSGFDRLQEVADLRVLAMRLDPPEIELPLDENADATPVTMTALLAGVEGEVEWDAALCPSVRSGGCESWRTEEGSLVEDLGSGSLEPPQPAGPPELLVRAEIELPPQLVYDLFEHASMDGLAGARPAIEVLAASKARSERAVKRLQISLPDLAYRMLMQEAGIEVCDEQGLPEGCIDYRTRVPNSNPTIERVEWQSIEPEGSAGPIEPMPQEGPLVIAPGETIWLVPAAGDGSAESYQSLALDYEDRSVFVEDRTEMLVWSWFTTAGELGRDRTEEDRTRGERNRYTAPSDAAELGEDVWIWLVLRDNRGGVDFSTLHLRVE